MRAFLLIERPQHFDDDPLPSGKGWTSVGQFYDFIRRGLLTLVEELGEDKVSADAGSGRSVRRTSTTPVARRCPSPT